MKFSFNLLFIILIFGCGNSPTLLNVAGEKKVVNDITALIQDSGLQTNIGMKVVNINSGETLYEWNSQALFNPASNNKLYTCVATITLLDSTFAFKTRVYLDSSSIYLVGGGDPDLRIEHLEEMAQVTSDSIKLFLGRDYYFVNNRKYMRTVDLRETIDYLILDDSIVDDIPFGHGWMWDEGSSKYVAQLTGLNLNKNCVNFFVTPGKVGKPAIIRTYPVTDYINIENHSLTKKKKIGRSNFKIERDWVNQTNNFIISGGLWASTQTDTVYRNINDPTNFTGSVFTQMLREKKINIKRTFRGQRSTNTIKIAEYVSPQIDHYLNELMKESDNITAELLVKHIGRIYSGNQGSWDNGLNTIKLFLNDSIGIDTTTLKIVDGSGLSRYNYSNADHFVKLLTWSYNNKNIRDKFLNTFAIGGKDGTLADRFGNKATDVNIIAKTGSLSAVSCLSGYIFSEDKDPLAFSILMNGYAAHSKPFHDLQDKIVNTLADTKL